MTINDILPAKDGNLTASAPGRELPTRCTEIPVFKRCNRRFLTGKRWNVDGNELTISASLVSRTDLMDVTKIPIMLTSSGSDQMVIEKV